MIEASEVAGADSESAGPALANPAAIAAETKSRCTIFRLSLSDPCMLNDDVITARLITIFDRMRNDPNERNGPKLNAWVKVGA
jgi:hypothetical protein